MENGKYTEEQAEKLAEKKYDSHDYSCAGYMCTVATTCYEPDIQRQICVGCLKGRILEKEEM